MSDRQSDYVLTSDVAATARKTRARTAWWALLDSEGNIAGYKKRTPMETEADAMAIFRPGGWGYTVRGLTERERRQHNRDAYEREAAR